MGEALNLGTIEAREARVFVAGRIAPFAFEEWWPKIELELDRFPEMWQEHWTKAALYDAVMNEALQVWGFGPSDQIRVVVFTQIWKGPTGSILQVLFAFGNSLEAALPIMEATFEKFAQITGCVMCEIIGRPGWERKLPRFRRAAVVLRCKVPRQGVH